MTIRLRVLSYNVHGLRDDVTALTGLVRQVAPDVAILQEAPRRLRWRTRCAQLANACGLVVAAGGQPALGNLILTSLRVRVRHSRCLRFPLTPGRHLRGVALAGCQVAGGRFVVAGSHLSTDPAERPGQATLLAKALSEADTPVIFGGDLNEGPDGPAWRTVAGGRVDAAAAAGPRGSDRGPGQPVAPPVTATFPSTAPADRLDVIFVDPGLTVRRYEVLDTAAARRASDHLPVVADLLLPASD